MLKAGGVKKAYALLGGYNAWVAAGYPIARGEE
jgi:3-mercaptopyruvate sulfurtransferase SseA